MAAHPRGRALAPILALILMIGGLVGARPAAAAATVTSTEVEYTFVVGEVGDIGERLLLDIGHTDAVAPQFVNEELIIRVKDDTRLHDPEIVYRDPADVVFQVKAEAETTVPDVPAYAFLGAPGDPVWILPMTQDDNLLWPGWSTEHGSLHNQFNSIQYEVTDVAGPGDFFLFLNDAFGNPIHRAASDGSQTNVWTEPVPAHVHSNWAFTEPGTYTITFQVSGEWLNAPDPVETAVSITGHEDLLPVGQEATLTAVQDPPTALDTYQWFLYSGPGDDHPIDGATTDSYTFTPLASDDGIQLLVRLYDDEGAVIAESEVVTINVGEPDPDPDPEPSQASQTIIVTLPADAGALVVSVDPNDDTVMMSDLELSTTADRYESSGGLRPVTVTDTRAGAPGWNVNGQVSDFSTGGGGTFAGSFLGWDPEVVSQAEGQGVTASDPIAPGFPNGPGLSVASSLASATSGAGTGTAVLGADLTLEVPTDIDPGEYTAVLTLTAI